MTAISIHGNDRGSITGNILVVGLILFLILATYSAYSISLDKFAKRYEMKLRALIEAKNTEIKEKYEIN